MGVVSSDERCIFSNYVVFQMKKKEEKGVKKEEKIDFSSFSFKHRVKSILTQIDSNRFFYHFFFRLSIVLIG